MCRVDDTGNWILEIGIFTTDQTLVDDLNRAGIDGVKAVYRPTMAFDSVEHLLTIIVETLGPVALAEAMKWLCSRYKKEIPKQLTINNQIVNSAENAVIIINNIIVDHSADEH